MKKAFNVVEISIVVCLLITTIVLCLPTIFNNTKGARIISGWKRTFSEAKSNFEIFNMNEFESIKQLCEANPKNLENEVFEIISPYLDVDKSVDENAIKGYNFRFYNGAHIPKHSNYYPSHFAFQEDGKIVGFKWLTCKCSKIIPCASVIFDINGKNAPNRLGKDVFGLYLYKDRIEAFGYDRSNENLKRDCNSKSGNGVNCSEYFLRGGKF